MTDQGSELQAISQRLQTLERSSRHLKYGTLLLLVALAANCVVATIVLRRISSAGVVRATDFILVDGEGNTRARLVLNEAGAPGLSLDDQSGNLRAKLEADQSGSVLAFYAEKGATQALLDADQNGSTLGFYEGGIYPVLKAQAGQAYGVNLSLFDSKDTQKVKTGGIDPRAELEFSSLTGQSQLTFSDERGKLIWAAPSR